MSVAPNQYQNDPMSRWMAIMAGQIQPTPEEARQIAMLTRVGNDITGPTGSSTRNPPGETGRNLMSILGNTPPGQAISGLGRSIGGYIGSVQDAGQQAFNRASGSAYPDETGRGLGNIAGAGPAVPPLAAPAPTPGMPGAGAGSADPEAAYSAAYQQAQATQAAGPAAPGPGEPGFIGPTQNESALRAAQASGSGAPTLAGPNDPGFIGPKQNPEADYSLAYDKAAGGDGPGLDYQRGIGQRYEADPQSWVEDLFHSRGVDESRNPYAQSWSKSWSEAMPMLLDFYVMAQGGDPFSPEARTKALQTFGPDVISGKIHPSKVIEQALNTAKQSPEVMASLVQMGPEAVMGMRVLSSGQSPRVANAYNTVLRRRLATERRRQIADPANANAEIPINIATGRG